VATQELKSEPWKVSEPYPVAEGEEAPTHMVMVNWLTHQEPLDEVEELALGVLDHILMGTSSSLLYKAMIESGYGTAVVGGGLSDELKQATFSVGLKGVKAEDVAKVEELALGTLAKAVEEGFAPEAIESSLNTVEFSMREFNTGGFPKGLSLMLAIMPRWLYKRGAPTDALRFEAPLAKLKSRLEAGEKVFEQLLQKLIVANGHRSTVELVPDPAMAKRQQEQEESVLASVKEKLTDDDIAKIIAATAELKKAQLAEDSEEDIATIPRVGLADLERKVKTIPSIVDCLPNGGSMLTHPLPTAGVVYADVLFDMEKVPLKELPLARLFERKVKTIPSISTAMLFE
jgi:Zn-dependent M16 (insulinase) family peptidase